MTDLHETSDAKVVAVQDDIVTIESVSEKPLVKNEVVFILHSNEDGQIERLKAEVLRINGKLADAQVYEPTLGISVNTPVEQTGLPLSIDLGPGLLGQVFDGLQNPIEDIAQQHGFFLPKGIDFKALNQERTWHFEACTRIGDKVKPGDVLGTVPESQFKHKIFAPFDLKGEAEIIWLAVGNRHINDQVALLKTNDGQEIKVTLVFKAPIRFPLNRKLMTQGLCHQHYPDQPLVTGQRIIDSFFPIAKGGTACIPGPFGAGKTVLQHLLAKHSDVDIVVIVACGERAGEVVETITEFPHLKDPKTGNALMERTVIICNTSSMPVAAREASIYTGITIGEYYRQMGLNVLLLADSTSRWAQALRETSGRLEEIPGEEAFPAYLDSRIRALYERAGVLETRHGSIGSLTMIGTVSPAGGNFDEPVTQSTLRSVKTFLGLSSDRAYKRCYPAIDPLISWTRYRDQLTPWFAKNVGKQWTNRVLALLDLYQQGIEVSRMLQVTGEEGVSLEDFITYQKSLLIDSVFFQQDAFDDIDMANALSRQTETLNLIEDCVNNIPSLDHKEQIRELFNRLITAFKQLNYEDEQHPGYQSTKDNLLNIYKEASVV